MVSLLSPLWNLVSCPLFLNTVLLLGHNHVLDVANTLKFDASYFNGWCLCIEELVNKAIFGKESPQRRTYL